MHEIESIQGREILDSRGNPTVEADIRLKNGIMARASVPSGASTGTREAVELRDQEKRYLGKGVMRAVEAIQGSIAKALTGMTIQDQSNIDRTLIELDGTENKSRLGANALLAVSMACMKANALAQNLPLYELFSQTMGTKISMPVPLMNVLNGGAHADNNVDIQEFMIVPTKAKTFRDALRMGVEVYHGLKSTLKKLGLGTSVGDEGGFAPNLSSNRQALDLITQAIEQAGFKPGIDIHLALDVAASEFFKDSLYHLSSEKKQLTSDSLIDMYAEWASHYPIVSIEDGLAENDWEGWKALTARLGKQIQLVGDDVFVTNPSIFSKGIKEGVCNAILIKLNQIGTVTETLDTLRMASHNHYHAIISHRSGETEDTTIADLAVGSGVGQIKTGAPCRTDRVAKYNQLIRIEEMTGATFVGLSAFQRD